ncbi:MAG: hypothetical protein HQ490_01885 [Lutibacter sp.]|nr:hypothetical protein [Lutibacter sp.]
MIYLKSNPKGIDIQIQRIQQYLYDKLSSEYSCEIYAYSRAYKDNENGSIKPLAYVSSGSYKELLTDNNIKGLHYFFIEDDEAEILSDSCLSTNDVDIIFFVNDITKVRGDITHYADEEIKETVKDYIYKLGFKPQSVTKGGKALEGFDISKIKFIHPFNVFKIKITINNY